MPLMTKEVWDKIAEEARRETQKAANKIYLTRQNEIIEELQRYNINISMDNAIKKGRPKKL